MGIVFYKLLTHSKIVRLEFRFIFPFMKVISNFYNFTIYKDINTSCKLHMSSVEKV